MEHILGELQTDLQYLVFLNAQSMEIKQNILHLRLLLNISFQYNMASKHNIAPQI